MERMQRPVLLIHGGAGRRGKGPGDERRHGCAAALAAGWRILAAGGEVVDAVVAAVTILEDHPEFNAGIGSCLTAAGTVEMDASLMDGRRHRAGAVGALTVIRNPVQLARAVMEDGRHLLLVGRGAEAFAATCGVATAPPEYFMTARQRARWTADGDEDEDEGGDAGTVGAVAVDASGHVAAATSTGGLLRKLPGRVGDSAIIGAGTYADDRYGAASATGHGETIILSALARTAVDSLRDGTHPGRVAARIVDAPMRCSSTGVGIILVDRLGRVGTARSTPSMITGWRTSAGSNVDDPE